MKSLIISGILAGMITLSGCSSLIIAGAAAGAFASQDRRTIPTQLEDENIEIKSIAAIFKNDELWKDTNISVVSYNNTVLMVGQAPTAALKEKAEKIVLQIAKVSKVYNQIRVSGPISFFAARNDEYLTSKIKMSMLFTAEFRSANIKVITENSEVFLMGIVTQNEANKAADIARNISGVTKVIKVFEYTSNIEK